MNAKYFVKTPGSEKYKDIKKEKPDYDVQLNKCLTLLAAALIVSNCSM